MSKKLILFLIGICFWGSIAIGSGKAKDTSAIQCVALNIYYETSAKSKVEAMAITDVVMNRVKDVRYPSTPCDVIQQARLYRTGEPIPNKCQFSWFCDGKPDTPRDNKAWYKSVQWSYEFIQEGKYHGLTDGATHYHATYVSPPWSRKLTKVSRIDRHIFYK